MREVVLVIDWGKTIESYAPNSLREIENKAQILHYAHLFGDNLLHRTNTIAHFTASGFIVSPDASHVLFAHHNLYNVWAWTGGHCDGDGDFLAVALKEAMEETGLTTVEPLSTAVASMEILPVWDHMKRGAYVPTHLHLNVSYLLTAPMDQAICARPEENSAVVWIPADKLLETAGEWEMNETYSGLLTKAQRLCGL